MKKVVGALIVCLTFYSSAMAKKERGFDLTREIEVNVSAEKLWELLGPGFADVYKWASSVDHSEGKGEAEFVGLEFNTRACSTDVRGFDQLSEKLYKYDEASMNLAYEVSAGLPGFVTRASNDWTVISLGPNRSKLVMKAEFRSKGLMGLMTQGKLKKKATKTLEVVLNDAKVYAETGQISEAKQNRIAELSKKQKKAA